MSSRSINNVFVFALRVAIVLAAVSVALAAGNFGQYPSVISAAFLIVGEIALLLMGFTFPEMGSAVAGLWRTESLDVQQDRAIYFWEAAVRNALGLGVLGTIAGFAIQISSSSGSPALFPGVMAETVLTTVYGLVLAALFHVMALRLRRQGGSVVNSPVEIHPGETRLSSAIPQGPKENGRKTSSKWGLWIGSALFGSLILWAVLSPAAKGSSFSPFDWLFSWPAWLSVWGGALALALFLGAWSDGRALTLGFAYAGGISALVGLEQAMNGFAETSIPLVASGCSLMVSSCFAALVGMLGAAASRQDRGRPCHGGQSRLAWYGLPVAGLIVVALVVLMAMIPITMKAETGG